MDVRLVKKAVWREQTGCLRTEGDSDQPLITGHFLLKIKNDRRLLSGSR